MTKKRIRLTATRIGYKRAIKPILFRFSPDKVHASMVKAALGITRVPIIVKAGKKWLDYTPNGTLQQSLAGLYFESPVGIAAGLDKNGDLVRAADMIGCGFTEVGSVTYEPREGNPRPWFYRLPKTRSIVVNAGMANRGLKHISQRLRNRPATIPVFVSIAVVSQGLDLTDEQIINDVIKATDYIAKYELAEVLEINISCPNVHDDEPFTKPNNLEKLLSAIDKRRYRIPMFVKMPNRSSWKQFERMVDVVLEHKVQGLTIANLVKDRENINLEDNLTDDIKGGLSGLPTRERSNALIQKTRKKVGKRLVIVGLGGIFNAEDAYEKLKAGADLVETATGLIFEGPQLVNEINAGLEKLMARDGFGSIGEIHEKMLAKIG